MTICMFLKAVGVIIELLAYFNVKDWAEQKALAIKDLLPVVTAGLGVLGQLFWKGFIVVGGVIAVLGLLVRCTVGGLGPDTLPLVNLIAYPFAALGTGMFIAFVLAVVVGVTYVFLEFLANTPRGLLAGIGLVCLILGFLLNC
jgi:hypothetical protein